MGNPKSQRWNRKKKSWKAVRMKRKQMAVTKRKTKKRRRDHESPARFLTVPMTKGVALPNRVEVDIMVRTTMFVVEVLRNSEICVRKAVIGLPAVRGHETGKREGATNAEAAAVTENETAVGREIVKDGDEAETGTHTADARGRVTIRKDIDVHLILMIVTYQRRAINRTRMDNPKPSRPRKTKTRIRTKTKTLIRTRKKKKQMTSTALKNPLNTTPPDTALPHPRHRHRLRPRRIRKRILSVAARHPKGANPSTMAKVKIKVGVVAAVAVAVVIEKRKLAKVGVAAEVKGKKKQVKVEAKATANPDGKVSATIESFFS